jgi:hypothetical protein
MDELRGEPTRCDCSTRVSAKHFLEKKTGEFQLAIVEFNALRGLC